MYVITNILYERVNRVSNIWFFEIGFFRGNHKNEFSSNRLGTLHKEAVAVPFAHLYSTPQFAFTPVHCWPVPVGVLFIIWNSVGSCEDRGEETASTTNHCDTPTGGDNLESNIVVHADCHSANKGLFGGIIVLVLCVVSIILFFIAISDEWVWYCIGKCSGCIVQRLVLRGCLLVIQKRTANMFYTRKCRSLLFVQNSETIPSILTKFSQICRELFQQALSQEGHYIYLFFFNVLSSSTWWMYTWNEAAKHWNWQVYMRRRQNSQ